MDFSHKWKKSRHNSPQTTFQKTSLDTSRKRNEVTYIYGSMCVCVCVCVCVFVVACVSVLCETESTGNIW